MINSLSLFESCEINLLVKVVSKNLIRKSQEASLTESYKQAAFTFFNCLVQGSARVWTGKFVECVCRCFNAKKALELMTGLCAGTMDAVCMMKLVKLSIEKDLVRPVLQILKEMLLGKGKYKGSCDVCRFFLLVLYNASKERENLQIVIEGLKVVEDLKTLKGLELDAGVLNSIKLNLEL